MMRRKGNGELLDCGFAQRVTKGIAWFVEPFFVHARNLQ